MLIGGASVIHWIRHYWREYRRPHPQYAIRNLLLQRRRNLKRCGIGEGPEDGEVMAKMDALDTGNDLKLQSNTEYWPVPVIGSGGFSL